MESSPSRARFPEINHPSSPFRLSNFYTNMEFPVYNQEAQQIGTVELADGIFGLPLNQDLLYQVVTSQVANHRQVVAHTKGRAQVRRPGKKPPPQHAPARSPT